MKKNNNGAPLIQILNFGMRGVGKLAIVEQFGKDLFNESRGTVDCSLYSLQEKEYRIPSLEEDQEVEEKKFKVQLWSLNEQDTKDDSLLTHFFKITDCICLVYDITDRDSFDSIDLYVNKLEKFDFTGPIILIGNKSDLDDNRAISPEEGKELADIYAIEFFETSAKTNEGIEEAIECVVSQYYSKNY
ncbi:unnamed protein product [Moneuplotes crassus]|uniref:Uncharacterized protein n=1 Tax=Euplotes crassus TaxID=5936 RepID=A0AAD2D4U7_EUPCR|nr:unnamed protein product [Moneuplotes crassus]